jgi:SAM-dependent methyltransferase
MTASFRRLAAQYNGSAALRTKDTRMGLANFFSLHYQDHNRARLEHLASLGLPLSNCRVLELGSGPGDHTGFYAQRGCATVAVDARQDCLATLKAETRACDLNDPSALADLGAFDVIHCYGILYHLENPAALIGYIGEACRGTAIVETCVSAAESGRVDQVEEITSDYTQSSTGRGCRPGRRWVFEELRRVFPFVYNTRTQPRHPEFPIDWNNLSGAPPLIRAVFVASKRPHDLPSLSPILLDVQERFDPQPAEREEQASGLRKLLSRIHGRTSRIRGVTERH